MVLFWLAWSIIVVLNARVSKGLSIPFPVTFGSPGDNVTIYSNFRAIYRSFLSVSWYRVKPDGGMEHKMYFSSYSSQYGRYRGTLPQNSPNVSLTIYNVTAEDSGQYFPVVLNSMRFSPGTMAVLSITDRKEKPTLRVFVSQKSDNRTDILCELRGQGPDRTGPEWETEGISGAEIKTGEAIDYSGVFTRISILSVSSNSGPLTVTCVNQKNTPTIRRSIIIRQKVLILATIISAVQVCWRN
ncbi:uncharacterized protein LOC108925039 isoform X2 [Scleropages formosus]|uniref:uncharacterized protein LOC108925039 isoform X2 n=1 Tax=Scleropages formosus TaxID=113540 RepID=UPI000878D5E4|nr:uncharacterized protein LOC108925039 isoform X2 [Scleropages formosus]